MKKRRLKPAVKITLLSFLFVCLIVTYTVYSLKTETVANTNSEDDFVYVNDYIFNNYYPVVNQEVKITKPYTSEKVSVYSNFYEKDATEEEQKKSIIYHEGIYMQNTGVTYSSDEEFDVTAILSGTVTNVLDDTLLGKTIEVTYSSNIVVMYQSLGEVAVKKGDIITQGQILAKSGVCTLNNSVKNGLHLEIYKNGTIINPEKYFDKSIDELSGN